VHTLVRRYIKTAIFFLAIGLGLGGWMMVQRELYQSYPSSYMASAHTHALLVGFMMMMILGVALWLFPRPDKSDERYRPANAEVAYWLLAVGTAGRIVGELLRPAISAGWLRWAVVLLAFAQIAGILLFFHTMWGRIRPLGSKVREASGERF
jgi:heme/copper-type cytochrome/quinol oxidase subunit 1